MRLENSELLRSTILDFEDTIRIIYDTRCLVVFVEDP